MAHIAQKVLAWVAYEKTNQPGIDPDDLRRVELCAQAVMEQSMLVRLLEGERK